MKITNKTTWLALSLIVAVVGCENSIEFSDFGDKKLKIRESQLAGTVEGKSWEMRHGQARLRAEGLELLFSSEEFESAGCQAFLTSPQMLWISVKASKVGEYDLSYITDEGSASVSSTNDDFAQVIFVKSGRVIIEDITDFEVSGRLVAYADEGTQMSGTFTVPLCESF